MKFRERHSSSKDSVVSWLYCYTKLQFSGLFCVNLRIEKDTYAEPQIIAKCLGLIRRFSNSFFPERTTFPKAQFKSDSSDCSYINILTFELNMYFGFTQINSCLVFTLRYFGTTNYIPLLSFLAFTISIIRSLAILRAYKSTIQGSPLFIKLLLTR